MKKPRLTPDKVGVLTIIERLPIDDQIRLVSCILSDAPDIRTKPWVREWIRRHSLAIGIVVRMINEPEGGH